MRKVLCDLLKKISKVTNSSNDEIKALCPDVLIVTDNGTFKDDFIDEYTDLLVKDNVIMDINKKYPCIKLKFPAVSDALSIEKFYISPDIYAKASYENKYRGVFYIDLCDVETVYDDTIIRLLEFIKINKANIKFVIHVMPNIRGREIIFTKLRGMIIENINLCALTINESVDYIISELDKIYVGIDKEIKYYIEKRLELLEYDYLNYEVLDMIVSNLIKETCYVCSESKKVISIDTYLKIEDKLYIDDVFSQRKIGF